MAERGVREMNGKFYIAYGSNMSVEQMSHRCPDAELVGTAILEGWRLIFKGCATIEEKEGYGVPVLVWRISESDERNLDHYEGYPGFYFKETVPIRLESLDGYTAGIEAMVYIMDEKRTCHAPSSYYYGVIEDAYRVFGLDLGVLEKALEESTGGRGDGSET